MNRKIPQLEDIIEQFKGVEYFTVKTILEESLKILQYNSTVN